MASKYRRDIEKVSNNVNEKIPASIAFAETKSKGEGIIMNQILHKNPG